MVGGSYLNGLTSVVAVQLPKLVPAKKSSQLGELNLGGHRM